MKRYKESKRKRFLSPEETERRGEALRKAESEMPIDTRTLSSKCTSVPNLVRAHGGDAREVQLHRTDDQRRIRATRLRRAKVELELAHLVCAQGASDALFTLYPHVDTEYRAHVRRGRQFSLCLLKIENRIVCFQ